MACSTRTPHPDVDCLLSLTVYCMELMRLRKGWALPGLAMRELPC